MSRYILIGVIGMLVIPSNAIAGKYHPVINYIHPLPESADHLSSTTIILKLDSSYLDDIPDLSSLISVSGSTGSYIGEVFFSSDKRTIIFKPDQRFPDNDTLSVKIETSQFAAEDFDYTFYTGFHPWLELKSLPLSEDSEYIERDSNSISTYKSINGVTVPADFPEITTELAGQTAPGLIFYATHYRHGAPYFIVLDNEGEIYYYLQSDIGDFGNVTVHPNNVLSLYSYSNTCYYVFDTTFSVIDTIYRVNSHELQFLENGHRLSFYNNGCGEVLEEFDSVKNLIFVWRSCDYLDEFPHINSIDLDYDKHYILSNRDLNEVMKINRETGEIIWRLGGKHDMFTYINDDYRLERQHDARPIRGHPNHYLVYDNGQFRNRTRVVEYLVDTSNWTAEKVWEFSDPENFCYDMGSAQRFENGNTFIDYPHPNTHALEVNTDGEVVFRMNSAGHRNYRCRRYDWFGRMKHPMLDIEDMQGAVNLVFNHFGDTTIGYYNIYYGLDKNNLQLIDSTLNTNYIAYNLQNYSTYFFGVTSVNKEGVESEMSDIKEQLVRYGGSLEDIIKNGEFDGASYWKLNLISPAAAERTISEGYYKVEITDPGTSLSDVKVTQPNITLINGKKYLFEFDAYADQNRIIESEISQSSSPFTNYSKIGKTYITTKMQHFKYEFVMEDFTDTDAILIFNLGEYSGDVFLDNVSLKYLDDNINPDLSSYARINFHKPFRNFPVIYRSDTGDEYGDRGGGLTYGWLGENNNAVVRNAMVDIRFQSFNYLKKDNVEYTWEIEVPNGPITAKIGMGDPLSTNQINEIYVENFLLADSDGEDNYDEVYVNDIEVKDGKFTIKPGPNAVNAKIAYIDIFYYYEPGVENSLTGWRTSSDYCMTIYPVPASDILNIHLVLPYRNIVEIELVDILGRIIDKHPSEVFEAGSHELGFDISAVPEAVYFVNCIIDGEKFFRKVIIQ